MAISGIVLNFLYILYVNGVMRHDPSTGNMPDGVWQVLVGVLLISWLISLSGLVMMWLGKKRPGGIAAIVGAVIFVPLGLVAIIGARRVMSSNDSDTLADRRVAAGRSTEERT
ncbi:hypothetical protein [Kushneria avicenniae]